VDQRLNERYADHYLRSKPDWYRTGSSRAFQQFAESMYGDVVQAAPRPPRILDVGCGTGVLLQWLVKRFDATVVGVDSSRSMLTTAGHLCPSAVLHCADGLEFLRRTDSKYDVVFCLHVLEHIADTSECLAFAEAAKHTLVPGGKFIVYVPNGANLTATQTMYHDLTHARLFTAKSLIQLLSSVGFEDVEIRGAVGAGLSGRIRSTVEHTLHRAVYRLCGHSAEEHFSRSIAAIATA
jgi:2-polyprenyl-3-methyl-5-hydroxy-6-metoxy-1,4-benzoquinol methylase